MSYPTSFERSAIYAGLIRGTEAMLDIGLIYCPHGDHWNDCAACAETPSYEEEKTRPFYRGEE